MTTGDKSDPQAPRSPDPEALPPAGDDDAPAGADRPKFTLEVASENASEAMGKLKDNVQYWVQKGRYNKVRVKRKGKPVLPDIPVGALVAFEAATFFWTGLLRGVLFNTVGRAFFEVELINEAEEHYRRGLEHFLAGDLPEADVALSQAVKIDDRHARAQLQMGVMRKVQGRKADAIGHFERAVALEPKSEAGREAALHLKKLKP